MSLSSIASPSTPSPSTTGSSAETKTSTEAEFMRFVKMSPIDRMRAGILKSMDLTEDKLAALSPAERQKIEDVIKKKIQEALAGPSSGRSGNAAFGAAPTDVEAPAAAAKVSASTLGSLIALQAGTAIRTAA